MVGAVRNVFISHKHEDHERLHDLKQLVEQHGMTWRDYSITSDNPNDVHNEEYIKREVLEPRIRQSSCLVVYISENRETSDWVDWEIEYAGNLGKRIVGVFEKGAPDSELPESLHRCADAIVAWNVDSIIDAITGKYGHQNRLVSQETPGQVTTLDPLDVSARLNEFRLMEDGWLDGSGLAPNHAGLDWLSNTFASHYPSSRQLPYTYPTPEGGVQFEWSLGPHEISLEIDLGIHMGIWHCLDLTTDASEAMNLDLNTSEAWNWLADQIQQLNSE